MRLARNRLKLRSWQRRRSSQYPHIIPLLVNPRVFTRRHADKQNHMSTLVLFVSECLRSGLSVCWAPTICDISAHSPTPGVPRFWLDGREFLRAMEIEMLVAEASHYAEANCGATQGGLLKGMASSCSRSFCWIQAIQETSMVMPKDAGPFPVKMVNTEMYLATFRCAGVVDMCKRDSMVFEAFCKGSRNWELQRN